ncbi:MAG: energy-coupled thiamine transporter ThiT [Clostridia bacterium]|nr:energy-coupled thiamine transporter ThiT [Clostridia bacterium]
MFHFSLLASYFDRVRYPDPENGNKYYLYEDVWTDYAKSSLAMTFLYVAIALAVVLIAIGIFVRLKKQESFASFLKSSAIIAVTFAVTVIVTMLSLGFSKISEKGMWQEQMIELVPPLVLAATVVLGIIASYVASLFNKKAFKITLIVSLSVMAAALVATIVCLIVYYTGSISGDGYYNDYVTDWDTGEHLDNKVNQLVLYLSAAALIAAAVAVSFVIDRKNKTPFDSRCIAFAGISVALSFALSYIKFWEMPQGGSITLASLLPVMLFAYVYGPKKGLLVGFVYGVLQAVQDAYIIHPAQFLLDYPIAFAMVAFAGSFSKIKALDKVPQVKFALGAILGGALRFFSHVLSGVFAFSAYAIDSGATNFWVYSLAYNSFVFVDLILVIVIGALLFSSKAFNRQLKHFSEPHAVPVSTDNTEIPADKTIDAE